VPGVFRDFTNFRVRSADLNPDVDKLSRLQ
jgi:hypothetical protein